MHFWLGNQKNDKLTTPRTDGVRCRVRDNLYEPVEKLLADYVKLCRMLLNQDKIGLKYEIMKEKAQ